jgi:hypothetical protein
MIARKSRIAIVALVFGCLLYFDYAYLDGMPSGTGDSKVTKNSAMHAFQAFPTCSSITSNGAAAASMPTERAI